MSGVLRALQPETVGLKALVSLGNLLEMQNLRSSPDKLNQETPEAEEPAVLVLLSPVGDTEV